MLFTSSANTTFVLFTSLVPRGDPDPRVPIKVSRACSSLFFKFLFNPGTLMFPLLATRVQPPRAKEGDETLALPLPASLIASMLSEGSVTLRGDILGVELLLLFDPALIVFARPPIMIEPDLHSNFLAPIGDSAAPFAPRVTSSGLISREPFALGLTSTSKEGRGGTAGSLSAGATT